MQGEAERAALPTAFTPKSTQLQALSSRHRLTRRTRRPGLAVLASYVPKVSVSSGGAHPCCVALLPIEGSTLHSHKSRQENASNIAGPTTSIRRKLAFKPSA